MRANFFSLVCIITLATTVCTLPLAGPSDGEPIPRNRGDGTLTLNVIGDGGLILSTREDDGCGGRDGTDCF
ncbi:hypothetical protein BKA93DRAFT_766252 [Sparassis latifolia]|uniref:Secreted protein n=1 Tax=Sparassis crispa TaxID=139825 RepID=A0A401GH71_9APHY|nr:hypothetical protein SCP_0312750 [Sparassis crispa]GBE81546.1 hypothetical protein SCP_0312750 [Sparassis crispa]